MMFKRGFEHLMEEGVTGNEKTMSALEFDEFDSNRKVKELSSLMREKAWKMIYTATSNEKNYPRSSTIAFSI